MGKRFLICIDCQNDFITGSLRNEQAILAVPNMVKKIHEFDGDAIFVTLDTHRDDYLSTKEGEKLPVTHCVKGSWGWNIEENVKAALNDASLRGIKVDFIEKPTFGSESLVDRVIVDSLHEDEIEIEIFGLCTDICVVSNALLLKAALYDRANITVLSKCCAGVTEELHDAAIKTMRSCQININ